MMVSNISLSGLDCHQWKVLALAGLWAILILCSPDLQAQALTGELTNDPSKTVKKYVTLDKQGARLHALSAEVLKPYVAWRDEPVWGQVVVIDEATVHDEVRDWQIVNPIEVLIPVTFEVVGVMHWDTATFLPEPRTEIIQVRVKAIDNRWRITEPLFPPHVSRKRLMDVVRLAWLDEHNPDRKERLDHLLQALKEKAS